MWKNNIPTLYLNPKVLLRDGKNANDVDNYSVHDMKIDLLTIFARITGNTRRYDSLYCPYLLWQKLQQAPQHYLRNLKAHFKEAFEEKKMVCNITSNRNEADFKDGIVTQDDLLEYYDNLIQKGSPIKMPLIYAGPENNWTVEINGTRQYFKEDFYKFRTFGDIYDKGDIEAAEGPLMNEFNDIEKHLISKNMDSPEEIMDQWHNRYVRGPLIDPNDQQKGYQVIEQQGLSIQDRVNPSDYDYKNHVVDVAHRKDGYSVYEFEDTTNNNGKNIGWKEDSNKRFDNYLNKFQEEISYDDYLNIIHNKKQFRVSTQVAIGFSNNCVCLKEADTPTGKLASYLKIIMIIQEFMRIAIFYIFLKQGVAGFLFNDKVEHFFPVLFRDYSLFAKNSEDYDIILNSFLEFQEKDKRQGN